MPVLFIVSPFALKSYRVVILARLQLQSPLVIVCHVGFPYCKVDALKRWATRQQVASGLDSSSRPRCGATWGSFYVSTGPFWVSTPAGTGSAEVAILGSSQSVGFHLTETGLGDYSECMDAILDRIVCGLSLGFGLPHVFPPTSECSHSTRAWKNEVPSMLH